MASWSLVWDCLTLPPQTIPASHCLWSLVVGQFTFLEIERISQRVSLELMSKKSTMGGRYSPTVMTSFARIWTTFVSRLTLTTTNSCSSLYSCTGSVWMTLDGRKSTKAWLVSEFKRRKWKPKPTEWTIQLMRWNCFRSKWQKQWALSQWLVSSVSIIMGSTLLKYAMSSWRSIGSNTNT